MILICIVICLTALAIVLPFILTGYDGGIESVDVVNEDIFSNSHELPKKKG